MKKTKEELLNIILEAEEFAHRNKIKNTQSLFNKYTLENYKKPMLSVVKTTFGNYGNARKEAGLGLNVSIYSSEKLIDRLYELYVKLGRLPQEQEIKESGVSMKPYYTRWGNLTNALKTMIEKKDLDIKLKQRKTIIKNNELTQEEVRKLNQLGFSSSPGNKLDLIFLFSQLYSFCGISTIENISPQGTFDLLLKDQKRYAKACIVYSTRNLYGKRNSNIEYVFCWQHNHSSLESKYNNIQIINIRTLLNKLKF